MDIQELSNKEAEQHCIGAALIDPDGMAKLRPLITVKEFFFSANQAIYQAMCNLHDSGQPVEHIGLMDELEKLGALDDSGESVRLFDIMANVPTAIYVTHYAALVKKMAWLRTSVQVASAIAEKAYSKADPNELHAYITKQLDLLTPQNDTTALLSFRDSFDYYDDLLQQLAEQSAAGPSAWRWPWHSWNRLIDPLQPSLPVLLSGDTGTGKTIYMENLAEWWAVQGLNVLFAHSELSPAVMQHRRMARHSGVPLRTLLSGNLSGTENVNRQDAESRMRNWRGAVHYLHTPGWHVDELVQSASNLRDKGKCDILVFDYMDKLEVSPRQLRDLGGSYQLRVADDMEQVKTLAERKSIGLVTAAQLNKAGKMASFDSLGLAHIGESGQRTNKVNVVPLLYRETLDAGLTGPTGEVLVEPGGKSPKVQVKIAKNTLGQIGRAEQYMEGARFRVTDLVNDSR